jgi:hypothetical protein
MSEISPDTRERDVEGERRVQFLYHTPEVLKKQQHEEEVASSSPSSPPTGLVVTSDLTGEEVAEQERARAEAAGEVIRIDNTPSPGTRDDDDGIGPPLLKTAEAVAAGGRRRRFQNRRYVSLWFSSVFHHLGRVCDKAGSFLSLFRLASLLRCPG